MAQDELKISPSQSKIFARAIYSDVAAYIQAHQEEYQKFLQEEDLHDEKENQGTR